MPTFAVKVDGKERIVEIDAGKIRVDGVDLDVSIEDAGPGLLVLRQGMQQTIAQIDGTAPKLTVEIRRPGADPVVVAAEVSDARKVAAEATKTAHAAGPVTLRSPIPGRVAKLLVKPGDKVTASQTIVVLEAMKMENELRAPRAGTVSEIRCAEGAPVEAGQELATIV